jgi:ATP-dependent DNA helicase DinG
VLLDAFKARSGSVLFGTASFWEGVDVVGDALSLVVIDKLPFQPPDDPLVAARAARLEDEGHDPFQRYHLPRAALQLAQGFGRLIRHRGDRGVVALLDRRAVTRSYGRRVLAGLPPECPRTGALEDVGRFFGVAVAGARA